MHELSAELDQKRARLLEVLESCAPVAVAFSAGVDSTVVAKAAQIACGDEAVAVTAESDSLPQREREQAAELASLIGIRHQVITTREFENPLYTRNDLDRCYHCKHELYDLLGTRAAQFGFRTIVNGANLDDRGDYRPGMRAAGDHAVRSPLIEAEMDKSDVRALARFWDLPVWDKPAGPCLSSRIAYGLEVTPERVARVDAAETWLRETFGLDELRVRCQQDELARIEVPAEALTRLTEEDSRRAITKHLRSLGFQYVTLDLEGFRSGSMNAVIPIESLLNTSPASTPESG